MTSKTFVFPARGKLLQLEVAVENGIVLTSKYCPLEMLTGRVNLVAAVNGEPEDEFLRDCQNQIIGMEGADGETTIDVHIAGLMAVVMDHLARCGRLLLGDLLLYMDCFSLLLEADGLSSAEIREIYPRVTRTIADLYPAHIESPTPTDR